MVMAVMAVKVERMKLLRMLGGGCMLVDQGTMRSHWKKSSLLTKVLLPLSWPIFASMLAAHVASDKVSACILTVILGYCWRSCYSCCC